MVELQMGEKMIRKVVLSFDDKEFNKLENLKEEGKILKKWDNWEDYILKLARVRK